MRDKFLVLFLAVFISLSSAICYYPNGDASPQDLPCSDDTDHSTCCGPGYACLTNNICIPTGLERQIPNAAKYVRGSCTDKTWRSSHCPNFCVNAEHGDTLDGGIGIAKCPGPKDMYYCMDGWPFDCSTGENVLSFQGTPNVVTTIGVVKTSATPTPTPTPTTSSIFKTPTASSPSVSSSATTPTPSLSSSTLGSSSLDTSVSSAPLSYAAAPTNSTLPSVSANQTTSSLPIALIAGLAAGISVGVIGLAAAAFMAHRRYQTKKRLGLQPPPPPPFNNELTFGHSKAELYTKTAYKKPYDPAVYSYSQPNVVYELAVERTRTPELAAGRQF